MAATEQPLRRFGCKHSTHHPKDKAVFFRVSPAITAAVHTIDLRSRLPPVGNQGEVAACTAFAVGTAFQANLIRRNLPAFTPSYLFLYYNERLMEDSVSEDNGAQLTSGLKSISTTGLVSEAEWPYVEDAVLRAPPPALFIQAQNHKCNGYYRVGQTVNQINQALINGFPVIAGIDVYTNFLTDEVSKTGVVPLPTAQDVNAGGHAVLIVGFDDTKQVYTLRNSWGAQWGMQGHFTLPYEYITERAKCKDLWVISSVRDTSTMKKVTYSQLTTLLGTVEAELRAVGTNFFNGLRSVFCASTPEAGPSVPAVDPVVESEPEVVTPSGPSGPVDPDVVETVGEDVAELVGAILRGESISTAVENFTKEILAVLEAQLIQRLTPAVEAPAAAPEPEPVPEVEPAAEARTATVFDLVPPLQRTSSVISTLIDDTEAPTDAI